MACFLTLPKLSLCVILCFVANKQATSFEQFGCTFETSQYKTNITDTPILEKKHSNGIYINSINTENATLSPTAKDYPHGEAPTGEAAKGSVEHKVLNTYEWDLFKWEIYRSFVYILEEGKHMLNDVDPFIKFIKSYNDETVKRQKGNLENISIEAFVDEYNVPYARRENPAGLIIELFREIQNRDNVSVKLEPYLVTAYVNPPEVNVTIVKNNPPEVIVTNVKNGYANLTKTRFQDHVGGVIQIYYENRLGYILLEPGYYNAYLMTPFAVVLMADGLPPHGEFIFNGKKEIVFTMGDPSDMYVVATDTRPAGVGIKNMVYYLGRAYCSFLESTTKGNLLRSNHGIVSFNSDGSGNGFLSIDINKPIGFLLGSWEGFMMLRELDETNLYPVLTIENMVYSDIFDAQKSCENKAYEIYSPSLWCTSSQLSYKMQSLIATFFKNMTQYVVLRDELTTLSNRYKLEKYLLIPPLVRSKRCYKTETIKTFNSFLSKKLSKTLKLN